MSRNEKGSVRDGLSFAVYFSKNDWTSNLGKRNRTKDGASSSLGQTRRCLQSPHSSERVFHCFGESRKHVGWKNSFFGLDERLGLKEAMVLNEPSGQSRSRRRSGGSVRRNPFLRIDMLLDKVLQQFHGFLDGLRRATPLPGGSSAAPSALRKSPVELLSDFYDDEEEGLVPLVLVAGASGRTGRLIVRKLLLQGFRVRALVRNLVPETLDELGTGCEYVKADLLDKDSLLEAVYGVDKVISAISDDSGHEAEAVSNLLKAFQDARFLEFGRRDSAKVTIFKFNKPRHFSLWTCSENRQTAVVAAGGREQSIPDQNALGNTNPSVLSNASGKGINDNARLRDPLSYTFFEMNDFGNAVFRGKIRDVYRGQAEVFTTSFSEKPLNFRGFSGIILRCLGDGQRYSLVIRTKSGMDRGVQFISTFSTAPARKWITVRLAFPDFLPQRLVDGILLRGEIRDATVFDFSEITQVGLQYEARENFSLASLGVSNSGAGSFSLTVDYMKAFRTQDEPEFILLSCMVIQSDLAAAERKRFMEEALKTCGLSYCIMRTGLLTDEPGGMNSITFDQTQIDTRGQGTGLVVSEMIRTPFARKISRADVADVCVASLLDARACNVTFDLFTSPYAPTTRVPTRNYSALFETLKPNT